MLAVTVMLVVPGEIKRLHLIEIQNDGTGTPAVGNYDVRLWSDSNVDAKARVENHDRGNNAMQLVTKAIVALAGPLTAAPVPVDDIEFVITRHFFQIERGQDERLDRIFAWLDQAKPISEEMEPHQ